MIFLVMLLNGVMQTVMVMETTPMETLLMTVFLLQELLYWTDMVAQIQIMMDILLLIVIGR